MAAVRKVLSAVALILGLVTAFNFFLFAVNPPAAQTVWDLIDPLIILVLAAVTLLNISDSVQAHGRSEGREGQFRRDVLTALVGMTVMFYLHNYLLKITYGVAEANPWIWHFIVPPVVVMLIFEGLALRQRDN